MTPHCQLAACQDPGHRHQTAAVALQQKHRVASEAEFLVSGLPAALPRKYHLQRRTINEIYTVSIFNFCDKPNLLWMARSFSPGDSCLCPKLIKLISQTEKPKYKYMYTSVHLGR